MKKLVTFFLLLSLSIISKGQQVTDTNLKNIILASCPTCLDTNGNLLPEARTITGLSLHFGYNEMVRTSKGLEGFINLDYLTFSRQGTNYSNAGHKFDSLPPNLSNLFLDNADYERIDKLPTNLLNLSILSYLGSILPQFPNSLTSIALNLKNATSLPVLPSGLTKLHLNYADKLISLPELPTTLRSLVVSATYNTQLVRLPILPPRIFLCLYR